MFDLKSTRLPRATGFILGGIALLAPVFLLSDFRIFQLTMAVVYAVALLGLNLLTGYSGQISLGHSAFFGVGAYTAAILVAQHDLHYLWSFPTAGIVCFVLGFIVGIPALRLRGLYLALLTLGIAIVFPALLRRFDSITGGAGGISISEDSVAAPSWFSVSNDQYRYLLLVTVAIVLFGLTRNLLKGPVGRSLTAIRDNEIPAAASGISLARYKTMAFATSSALAGIAGAGYGLVIRFVSPGSFAVLLSIMMLAALVVGGTATIGGAVLGGLFLQFAPYYTQSINPALSGLIYGVLLIVMMLLLPGGIMSLLRHARFAGPRSGQPDVEPVATPSSPPTTPRRGHNDTSATVENPVG